MFKVNPSGIYFISGRVKKIINGTSVAYIGCTKCFRKVQDKRLDGFFCEGCKKVMKEKHFYFIHAIFEDISGMIQIGFSRE